MKITQASVNPYPNTDTNKRYYTYDYYMKKTFGGKCAKIPLDAGLTCPNIDGRCGTGGCIYCSSGSAADRTSGLLPLKEQYRLHREQLAKKWSVERCIPYFQAHTNTYAPLSTVKAMCEEAASCEGAVAISLATRADCLEDEKLTYFDELSRRIPVFLELGLQSASDETARRINRGHDFDTFCDAVARIRRLAPKVQICVHIINGLPGETREDMLTTARAVAALHPDQVKIHLMHVLSGTALGRMYEEGKYIPMTQEDYVSVTVDQLELLPPDTVIGRLTGDGLSDELLAPDWSRKKTIVLNEIDKELFRRGSYQGIYFSDLQ